MEVYEIHRDHGKTSYTLGGDGPAWGYLEGGDEIYYWIQQWFQPKVYTRLFGKLDIVVTDEGIWELNFVPDQKEQNGERSGNCTRDCDVAGRAGKNTTIDL